MGSGQGLGACGQRKTLQAPVGARAELHSDPGADDKPTDGTAIRTMAYAVLADSVRTDTDDVFSAECTFVNAGRSDPNVPLRIADRQISAGHGRKSFVIYPLHKHDDLVCWMDILNIHIERSL